METRNILGTGTHTRKRLQTATITTQNTLSTFLQSQRTPSKSQITHLACRNHGYLFFSSKLSHCRLLLLFVTIYNNTFLPSHQTKNPPVFNQQKSTVSLTHNSGVPSCPPHNCANLHLLLKVSTMFGFNTGPAGVTSLQMPGDLKVNFQIA